MIEGSGIDQAAHRLDIPAMTHEVVAFDEAARAVYKFAKKRRDTLVVITADHETGGLSFSDSTNVEKIAEVKVSSRYLLNQSLDDNEKLSEEKLKSAMKKYLPETKLSSDDIEVIEEAHLNNKGEHAIGATLSRIFNVESVSWKTLFNTKTHGHTSSFVPVFSFGLKSHLFRGKMENIDIPSKIAKAAHVKLSSQ
jgi:alkaline phosphatase